MSTPNNKLSESMSANPSQERKSTEFLLSLAVGPMLFGVLATDAVFSWLQAIGTSSEEVFRGNRLPVLHFPESGNE
jgi:predicted branched-subunit amino acid permease